MKHDGSDIKDYVESFLKLHKTLGFKGLVRYILIGLAIFTVFNFRKVTEEVIYFFDGISQVIHDEALKKRDELLMELNPLLAEVRAVTGADRILYIEFHNSKENLVGIPFKYLELVMANKKYGVPEFDIKKYQSLNAGILAPIFPELRKVGYVANKGESDPTFLFDYHEVSEFIYAQDSSVQQVYLNLPGINTPIGIIVLEWMDDEPRDWDEILSVSREYVARINGLVLSKTRH